MPAETGRPVSWLYKLRKSGKSGFSLNVPTTVAAQIPEGMVFELTVTNDGLLYTPATVIDVEQKVAVPWLQRSGNEAV